MRRDYFVFGGVNSLAHNVWLKNPHTEITPERDVELQSIPGRSGELIFDLNRWKNVKLPYELVIPNGFMENFEGLKRALLAKSGYQRLENSFEPKVYRLATVYQTIEPKTTPYHRAGECTITFDCKPQRFLKSGDTPIPLTRGGTVTNLTGYPAQPLICVRADAEGVLQVGDRAVRLLVAPASGLLWLDCEAMTAYDEFGSQNSIVGCDEYPVLQAGDTAVSWSGGITSVEITPRWWVL